MLALTRRLTVIRRWGAMEIVQQRGMCVTDAPGEATALYGFHVENGGKMVNFGGFLLPVQYSDLGIAASHLHTRKSASLFDVSHMLQTEIIGNDSVKYLESMCTADLENLADNSSVLTVLTNDQGGVLDDLIITKITANHMYIVSNAAMKQQDKAHLIAALEKYKELHGGVDIKIKFFECLERGLIALQGPRSMEVLQDLTNIDLSRLSFMTSMETTVCQVGACRITRCGYTGEDGFEISMPAIKAVDISREILKNPLVKLAGLGARDSLRLEAGLCLYGNDLTQDTTPVEAALTWLIAKRRRTSLDFPGAHTINKQITEGVTRKRVGLIAETGPPPRHGTPVFDGDNNEIGKVTSGCPAPSLNNTNIAMAYLPISHTKSGTKCLVKIRDRLYGAVVAKMPFVPTHYYTNKKTKQ